MSPRSFATFLTLVKLDETFARDLKSALVSVNENEISANDFCGMTKFERVGVATFTVNNVRIDPDENPKDADCVAVMIAFPDFIIVTVRPVMEINSDP